MAVTLLVAVVQHARLLLLLAASSVARVLEPVKLKTTRSPLSRGKLSHLQCLGEVRMTWRTYTAVL